MTLRTNGVTLLLALTITLPACAAEPKSTATAAKPAGSSTATTATAKPAAAPAPGAKSAWSEAAGWDVLVKGTEDVEARVFQSGDYQKYLIVPSGSGDAIVLGLKLKDVTIVPRGNVTMTAEDAAIDGAPPAASGTFTRQGSDISFTLAGTAWKLAPEPPLVGEITQADLLAKKKDYAAAARNYRPKNAAISLIRNASQPVDVTVFFGTWCSYCKHYLPGFLKTIETAANPNLHVRYFGVSEDMSQPEAELTKYGISRTPTIIVVSGGTEIGRIIEKPKGTIEEDLALLLAGGR